MSHQPVLLHEMLEALAPKDGEAILDGTFGGGGYTRAILDIADCRVLGVDRDLDAIERAEALAAENSRFTPVLGRFGDLDALALNLGFGDIDGVVLDLGVSSFQIDQAERGFSFMRDGPLDMRMGRVGPSAADVVNQMSERDLANIIYRLGEEKQSRRIAAAIVARRTEAPFTGTLALAETIEAAVGGRKGARIHPATRAFQAIRIYVNDELGEVARALRAAENILRPGGRLVVVTFHSLEDRIVKQFLRVRAGKSAGASRHLPGLAPAKAPSFNLLYRKAVEPQPEEARENPRARSSRLRAAVRTEAEKWDEPVLTGFDLPSIDVLESSS